MFTQRRLKLRHKRLLELLKDYDMSILYHQDKSNMVVDDLSRLSMVSIAHVKEETRELAKDVHKLSCLGDKLMDYRGGIGMTNEAESSLMCKVK